MQIITTALIADGTSDRALIPLLKLLLKEHLALPFEEPHLIQSDMQNLGSRIQDALKKYSLDILFVHRDAENESWERRALEIRGAFSANSTSAIVPVIPVKMTEAWLLTDSRAIRNAVGNPNSVKPLKLPKIANLESISAKDELFKALTLARELGTQRRRRFRPEQYRHRVAELTSDLDLIRQIPSFQRMEEQLIPVLLKINAAAHQ